MRRVVIEKRGSSDQFRGGSLRNNRELSRKESRISQMSLFFSKINNKSRESRSTSKSRRQGGGEGTCSIKSRTILMRKSESQEEMRKNEPQVERKSWVEERANDEETTNEGTQTFRRFVTIGLSKTSRSIESNEGSSALVKKQKTIKELLLLKIKAKGKKFNRKAKENHEYFQKTVRIPKNEEGIFQFKGKSEETRNPLFFTPKNKQKDKESSQSCTESAQKEYKTQPSQGLLLSCLDSLQKKPSEANKTQEDSKIPLDHCDGGSQPFSPHISLDKKLKGTFKTKGECFQPKWNTGFLLKSAEMNKKFILNKSEKALSRITTAFEQTSLMIDKNFASDHDNELQKKEKGLGSSSSLNENEVIGTLKMGQKLRKTQNTNYHLKVHLKKKQRRVDNSSGSECEKSWSIGLVENEENGEKQLKEGDVVKKSKRKELSQKETSLEKTKSEERAKTVSGYLDFSLFQKTLKEKEKSPLISSFEKSKNKPKLTEPKTICLNGESLAIKHGNGPSSSGSEVHQANSRGKEPQFRGNKESDEAENGEREGRHLNGHLETGNELGTDGNLEWDIGLKSQVKVDSSLDKNQKESLKKPSLSQEYQCQSPKSAYFVKGNTKEITKGASSALQEAIGPISNKKQFIEALLRLKTNLESPPESSLQLTKNFKGTKAKQKEEEIMKDFIEKRITPIGYSSKETDVLDRFGSLSSSPFNKSSSQGSPKFENSPTNPRIPKEARIIQTTPEDDEKTKNQHSLRPCSSGIIQEIQSRSQKIKARLATLSKSNISLAPDPIYSLKQITNRLSQSEIEFLKRQFSLKEISAPGFDIYSVDSIVSDLCFFTKFTQSIRLVFLSMSKLVFFKRGETVFRRGDSGDSMFVILRGSANVIVPRKKSKGYRIVSCLYDGSSFGEYSIIGLRAGVEPGQYGVLEEGTNTPRMNEKALKETDERTRRSATIEVMESAEMLMLDRKAFKRILMTLMQADLDDKLQVLLHLPYFDVEILSLFSLIVFISGFLGSIGLNPSFKPSACLFLFFVSFQGSFPFANGLFCFDSFEKRKESGSIPTHSIGQHHERE